MRPLEVLPAFLSNACRKIMSITQDNKATTKRMVCAVFPNPFRNDPWLQSNHPVLLQIAKELERQGCDCVPTPDFPSLTWLFSNRKKIDIIHFNWPEAYYRPTREVAKPFRSLLRLLHLGWLHAFVYLAKALRMPIVWTINDLYPHGQDPKRPLERYCRSFLMRNVSALILCAESAGPVVQSEFGPAKHTISAPLGNYRAFYPDTVTEKEARSRLGLNPDDVVFLCFGSMRESRNGKELISVFRDIPGKNLRLFVVGASPDGLRRDMELSAWEDPRIRCLFQLVSNNQLELLFKASDWVVVPGKNYLTSAVLVLGLSYGRPVISSDFGCAPSIAGNAGFLYNQDEPEGLKQAVLNAAHADLGKYRRYAQERAQHLSWEKTAKQMMKAFRLSLAESGRSVPDQAA